jgi:hypothetical protein
LNDSNQFVEVAENPLFEVGHEEIVFLKQGTGKFGVLARYALTSSGTVQQIIPILPDNLSGSGSSVSDFTAAIDEADGA